MAGSNWPPLRHLDLSCNNLTASAISQLTQLRWSSIEVLDLSNIPYLDPNAIQKLSSGAWPLLRALAIGGTFGLGFFAQVTASSWPCLETIQVSARHKPSALQAVGGHQEPADHHISSFTAGPLQQLQHASSVQAD